MKIPDQSAEKILTDLTSKHLLEKSAAAEVVEALEKGKDVNWNIVLSKQFEAEKGGHDETDS